MKKIILTRGIQGSGKTTWAKQWVIERPNDRIRINNDDIRNMLGKYWVPERESLVSQIRFNILRSAMFDGYNIVIDNMNLNDKEVADIENFVRTFNDEAYSEDTIGKHHYEIEFKDFFIPLETCIERDSKRSNPIGEEIIRKTYEKYKNKLC